jgi:predicted amidophosphoribosyltransferase
VAVLAVQRQPVIAKTRGSRRTADEILGGFARTSTPIPKSDVVVLVDDNVQSGNSLAALDRLLGATLPAAIFAVAVTDANACGDALKPRRFTIEYDDTRSQLDVICKLSR